MVNVVNDIRIQLLLSAGSQYEVLLSSYWSQKRKELFIGIISNC